MKPPAPFEAVSGADAERIRRRFPAVPARFSSPVPVTDTDPAVLVAPGMPRPKLDGVPIPATSLTAGATVDIIASDDESWRRTIVERRCDLCGESLAGHDRAWMAAERDPADPAWLLVRGGMHRRCLNATCHWCVHVRERLLDGAMTACSIPYADTFDERVFEILDHDGPDAGTHVIAEYRVALRAVRVEWPFRGD